jgi:hypothetical protein
MASSSGGGGGGGGGSSSSSSRSSSSPPRQRQLLLFTTYLGLSKQTYLLNTTHKISTNDSEKTSSSLLKLTCALPLKFDSVRNNQKNRF